MPTDTSKPKPASRSEARRLELRRIIPKPSLNLKALFLRRETVNALLIFLIFFAAASTVTGFSHDQLRLDSGMVMTHARFKRVDFTVEKTEATEKARQEARERAPHVYRLNAAYLNELREALLNLPSAVEGISDIAEVAEELRTAFGLDSQRLIAVQRYVQEGKISAEWNRWISEELIPRVLPRHPTIPDQDAQIERVRANPEFHDGDAPFRTGNFTELRPEAVEENQRQWRTVLREMDIPDDVAPVIAARLAHRPQPIYLLDSGESTRRADLEAARVAPVTDSHKAGEPIYRPGDVLSGEQLAVAEREAAEYRDRAPAFARFVERTGTSGVVALVTMFLAGYLIRFYPRVVRNPMRTIALALLLLLMLVASVWVGARAPALLYFGAIGAALLTSSMLVIAYDQRMAILVSGLQSVLITLALQQSIGFFVVLVMTGGAAAAGLRDLRHRNTLIRASTLAAVVAFFATLSLGLYETPLTDAAQNAIHGAWSQVWTTAGSAAAACMVVGFLMLGILPSIERLFDIPTGMTLVELRDSRHPLLRELQERAPGTYNHSLAVAGIAEAAADAVDANGLLTYVGALYHDIGKMNKPDYFVENQTGGPNKHEKLSPAMSLLVIVGHVKDGIELAREYGLPRVLVHFIESHHGTTLVEYFYHAARSRADGETDKVDEVEFRYPGPRPRTREAAILMIADACESATRALDEPGPGSIENLVRKLARKRLMDGQFDECDLTLRELATIEDAIIRAIWSLHHGRISYPTTPAAYETLPGEADIEPKSPKVEARTG